MKKNNYKKILFLSASIYLFFLNVNISSAANIEIKPSASKIGIGEQFYVDVLLDPQGESFNAIEGSIKFSPNSLFFVRIEDGKSMFSNWIKKPTLEGDTINFSGIATNGFDGVIDPFNPKSKLPGPILRIVFSGLKAGTTDFSISDLSIASNDGKGTIHDIPVKKFSIVVGDYENNVVLADKKDQDTAPQIEASVITDPNLFDNKYVLIFQAKDKVTGIKSVMLKEGDRDWKEINSPYLLEDQTRHSIINLRAMNYSGVSISTSIDAIPDTSLSMNVLYLICLSVIFLFLLFLKKYVHKK